MFSISSQLIDLELSMLFRRLLHLHIDIEEGCICEHLTSTLYLKCRYVDLHVSIVCVYVVSVEDALIFILFGASS
ncbi:hypothetical protein CSUI_006216 [Cystoisospora suis]|uniref:Uncharacterized protein n=1 Tax=Cystoisospora suis TaxID=483139 RepID=A0A2C6KUA5_9APIC|nr:hypothetical protein CSUI_006216 [Cystoisospora suis]